MILPVSMSVIISTSIHAAWRTRTIRVAGYLALVIIASSTAQILIGTSLGW